MRTILVFSGKGGAGKTTLFAVISGFLKPSAGQVRYAVLEFGGFLGMGTDRYPIPWKVLKYSTDKGGYVVPLDKTRLDKAPKYAESSAPVFDEDYGSRINTYYERF